MDIEKKDKMKRLKSENEVEKQRTEKRLGANRGGKSREKEGELEAKLSNSLMKENTPSHPKVLYLVVFLI